jgi:hypothetical protein
MAPGPLLEAAAADARPDDGSRGAVELLRRLRDDPSGDAAPAAVQHRHLIRRRERDRQAVGDLDQQTKAAQRGDVAVDLGPGCVDGVEGVGRRRRPTLDLGAMHLTAERDRGGSATDRGGDPAPVLGHPLGIVARLDAEVERLVGPCADAAGARREEHPRAGQVGGEDRRLDRDPRRVTCLAHAAPPAISSATRSSSSRPWTSPSSLRASVCSRAWPIAGDSGRPAASRSTPVISNRALRKRET